MTYVFLTSRLPYPPYRGDKLKVWNLLRQLSKRHKIILVSFIQNERERQYETQLNEVCQEIHLVPLPRWKSALNCVRAIAGSVPFQVAYYRSSRMAEALEQVLARIKPDGIHTHLIRMAQYTVAKKQCPRILDLTDAVSLYLSRLLSVHRNPLVRWLVSVELRRMLAYESVIERFDLSLVCSENDKQFLSSRIPTANIGLLYNGVDLEAFSVNGTIQAEPHRIIFTGNMSYVPNSDGAKFFAREIFPGIREKIPDAKLYIVGVDPPASVRALASTNIVVTGFVEDIRLEYLKSAVAVSPVRFGAGTLNKTLEPLALGIPVVSTPSCVEGLELQHGKEILIAKEPGEFVSAVVALMENPELRKSVGKAGMEKIRERFGWPQIATDLENMFLGIQRQTG